MLRQDLEDIIDEEILGREHSISAFKTIHAQKKWNHSFKMGESQPSFMSKMSKPSSTLPDTKDPNKKFKVELLCSQRHGVYGQLPVGMNHLYKEAEGHKMVANISVQ